MRNGVALMDSTHEEDQTDKQGYIEKRKEKKKSAKELITYTRYVLGKAASEDF